MPKRTINYKYSMKMKKIFLLVAVSMLTITGVNAQDDDPKQAIGISYGWMSNSDWLNIFESVGSAIVGSSFQNDKYFGPLALEYYYHLEPWISVGAIMSYGQLTEDVYFAGEKEGDLKNMYFTLMPAVKFDWLRRDIVSVYSKLGVGYTLRNESLKYDDSKYEDTNQSEFHVNWQVSLIGVELGRKLRGFAEYGVGEQGMLAIGMRYKF